MKWGAKCLSRDLTSQRQWPEMQQQGLKQCMGAKGTWKRKRTQSRIYRCIDQLNPNKICRKPALWMIVDFSLNLPDDLLFFGLSQWWAMPFIQCFSFLKNVTKVTRKNLCSSQCGIDAQCVVMLLLVFLNMLCSHWKKIENTLTSGKYGLRMALPVLL